MAMPVEQGAQLFAEIQRLADRIAISELLDRYAELFDDRTFTATLPTLFTEDANVELPPGDHHGIEGMDAFHADVMSPFGATQHIFTNYLIDLADNRADFRAKTLVTHHVPPSSPKSGDAHDFFVAGGLLTGAVTRTPDGWRFRQVLLDVIWRQGDFGPGPG
ncbi:MAG: hypothetical protein JWN03_8368 [Nocardia sp.]|uniref:nuclear transport factor 2 family protein n=1 Tax=Nocardia sp. TaxID=1821 RepID=UPI00261F8C93|nr:nuclear transport factor 2 family protein [Nocardia sp.]MCU1648093.1 hypothetical protein [Nocardia sp.]